MAIRCRMNDAARLSPVFAAIRLPISLTSKYDGARVRACLDSLSGVMSVKLRGGATWADQSKTEFDWRLLETTSERSFGKLRTL